RRRRAEKSARNRNGAVRFLSAVRALLTVALFLIHPLSAAFAGDAFGSSVASLGDVDHDGYPDFATVPAAAESCSGILERCTHPGLVICSGRDGRLLCTAAHGLHPFEHALCALGDVDGDGISDVAMLGYAKNPGLGAPS